MVDSPKIRKTPKISAPSSAQAAMLPQTADQMVSGHETYRKVTIELPDSLFWLAKSEAVGQHKKVRQIYKEALECYFNLLDSHQLSSE